MAILAFFLYVVHDTTNVVYVCVCVGYMEQNKMRLILELNPFSFGFIPFLALQIDITVIVLYKARIVLSHIIIFIKPLIDEVCYKQSKTSNWPLLHKQKRSHILVLWCNRSKNRFEFDFFFSLFCFYFYYYTMNIFI